jgi:hypothetical protein
MSVDNFGASTLHACTSKKTKDHVPSTKFYLLVNMLSLWDYCVPTKQWRSQEFIFGGAIFFSFLFLYIIYMIKAI